MIKVIVAEDFYKNKVYIMRQDTWSFYYKDMQLTSLSNFTSNAPELYIALNNLGEFDDVINVIKKHADYLLPESIKYHSERRKYVHHKTKLRGNKSN